MENSTPKIYERERNSAVGSSSSGDIIGLQTVNRLHAIPKSIDAFEEFTVNWQTTSYYELKHGIRSGMEMHNRMVWLPICWRTIKKIIAMPIDNEDEIQILKGPLWIYDRIKMRQLFVVKRLLIWGLSNDLFCYLGLLLNRHEKPINLQIHHKSPNPL